MSNTARNLRRSVAILGFVALASGCATPSTYEGMVTDSADGISRHPYKVDVTVGGGQDTSAMGKSQISDDTFQKALVESITKTGVFSQVVQGKGGDYRLNVMIMNMEQPSFGLSFTVKMEAAWSLRRADGTTVWQESIRSEHTATTSDAFVGTTRLRLATEGAARNNIKLGLAKISSLKL